MPDNNFKNPDDEKREVRVAFLSSTSLNDEELAEDEEEEDDEDEFDFNPNSLSSKQPRKRMVTMKILPAGQEVRVKCRLPWTWSWLQARIRLKYPPTSRYGAVQQMIDNQFSVLEYTLNPSKGQQGRSIINLLMTDICSNNTGGEKQNKEDSSGQQEEKKRFDQYLSEQPSSDLYLGRLLTPQHFMTLKFNISKSPIKAAVVLMKICRKSPESLARIFLPGPGGRAEFSKLHEGQPGWESLLPGCEAAHFLQVRPDALPQEAAGSGGR